MISKENLLKEIKELEQGYYAECQANGGKEGTTLAYGIKCQMDILIVLLDKYFEEEYFYNRMI